MASVRILNVCHVSLSCSPPQESVALSFLDAFWLCLPPVRLLFFYDSNAELPFSTLVESLKSSLSAALHSYYPLAGKLAQLPDTENVIIDCSAATIGDGIGFIEAECDADFVQLAGDETHDVEAFLRLVPELEASVLPVPVLAVQVTRFAGGGITIGVAHHHAAADGRAIFAFMEAWAETCRTGACRGPAPLHDRAVIRHPRGAEGAMQFLRQAAPDLPSILDPTISTQVHAQVTRRTFAIKPMSIQSLKEQAMNQCKTNPTVQLQPSTFVAVSAHAWISFTRAKALQNDEESFLLFVADCRARLDPPLKENFFGNCVKSCITKAKVSELLAKDGLAQACMAIKQAMEACLTEPLRDCDEWFGMYESIPLSKMMYLVASPRLRSYEMDFGWGKPTRVESISMNDNCEVAYMGTTADGCVKTAVGCPTSYMSAFTSLFVAGLDGH